MVVCLGGPGATYTAVDFPPSQAVVIAERAAVLALSLTGWLPDTPVTRVQLELLMLVAGPAIVLLTWDFSACRLALFGSVTQRLPEQRRNRVSQGASPSSGCPMTSFEYRFDIILGTVRYTNACALLGG
jgi:hypothetical protein